jgi:hypothetical protein
MAVGRVSTFRFNHLADQSLQLPSAATISDDILERIIARHQRESKLSAVLWRQIPFPTG